MEMWEVMDMADVVLVVGSQNSSNSRRLTELAQSMDIPAYLIDDASEIDPGWFSGDETVLITAGASAPETVVQDCVALLREKFDATVESRRIREEHVRFLLPPPLREIDVEEGWMKDEG